MKYQELIKLFKDRPFFEANELRVLFNENPEQIQANISRWVAGGKLIKLRRSKYLLPEEFRTRDIRKEYISNFLYRPSYISLRTALSIYNMIPEAVFIQEAVTTRKTAQWETSFGSYKYYSISRNRFWGYRQINPARGSNSHQQNFFIGEPEKALLDLFYLQGMKWNRNRIKEMRFQNLDQINVDKLLKYADKFKRKNIKKILERFLDMYF